MFKADNGVVGNSREHPVALLFAISAPVVSDLREDRIDDWRRILLLRAWSGVFGYFVHIRLHGTYCTVHVALAVRT
jgi:hypothetical protein